MEQATNDWIMDTQIKNTRQQRIQPYRFVKEGQLLHQGPSSAEVSSSHGGTQRNGDHFFSKGGGMIQVDIGGHPPIPLGPTPLFLLVFQFPYL
jgi:hypothetical protein